MTSPGHVRTAAARQARTRSKHLRWAAELAVAGWWVVEASHISIHASALSGPDVRASLHLWCERCGGPIAEFGVVPTPLPQVLAKVNGHVCVEPSPDPSESTP